jgi:signal transduction histidine kinase
MGVGIRGMRERIRQLGGTLRIELNANGNGTTVFVRLPVRGAKASSAAGSWQVTVLDK